MAKLLENGIESDEAIIDVDFEDVSGLQDDLDQELNSIFSEFGGDDNLDEYTIRVYRPQPGKGNVGYLFACLPAELPILDKLRDEYGGGDFEVRIIKNGKIFRRRKTIVEPPLKKPPAPPHNSTSELMHIVESMNNGFNRLGELMLENSKTSQSNPMNDQMQMLQNLVAMKELLGLDNQPAVKQTAPLTQLKELLELQQLMGGNSGGGSDGESILSLASNLLPKLAEIGKEEQAQKTMELQMKLKNPRGRRRRRVTQKITEGDNPMKMHLVFLTVQAKNDRDVPTYAHMVIDNTPQNKLNELRTFICGADALSEMIKVYPPVGDYVSWFTELGRYIDEFLAGNEVLTNPPQTTINDNTDIPGAVGSQSFATTEENTKENNDKDAVISDT